MKFKVPIRNLFCMLSYVNDMPELVDSLNDVDEEIITYDFIVNQFIQEVAHLSRRGLLRGYVARQEATNRLGGRLLINESIPYLVGKKPVVVCEKDEYSLDIPFNQILKATIRSICQNQFVKTETRKRAFHFLDPLLEVEDHILSKRSFSSITFQRHTIHYKRMIHLARMLFELQLLSHKHGGWSLFSAQLDEKSLNGIFEKFLFHFYRIEQKDYRISSEIMKWSLEGNGALLPQMKTDVSLAHRDGRRKIIMDAKFYKNALQENYGKLSMHSGHMYQLFTYLMHQKPDLQLRGILVYPENGVEVSERYKWDERIWMEMYTVDLNGCWKEIYGRLKGIIHAGATSSYS